ncbi:MAG TPA: proline/glycine betaine ABC transporter permease, partial [Agromyces sp.]|nr:proline/glycine betaine ABC transporter permease [Agromyces sp.]
MSDIRLPLGDWAAAFIDLVTALLGGFFAVVRDIFAGFYDAIEFVLQAPPFWIVIIGLAAIAWL